MSASDSSSAQKRKADESEVSTKKTTIKVPLSSVISKEKYNLVVEKLKVAEDKLKRANSTFGDVLDERAKKLKGKQEENDKLARRIKTLEQEKKRLEELLETTKADKKRAEVALNSTRVEENIVKQTLEAAEAEKDDLMSKNKTLQLDCKGKDTEISALKDEKGALIKERDAARTKLKEITKIVRD